MRNQPISPRFSHILITTLLLSSSGLLTALFAQDTVTPEIPPAPVAAPAPTITCDEPVWNFGEAKNDKGVSHSFLLKNTGDAELLITRVKATCGCTVAEVIDKKLAPGGSTRVEAVLDLKKRVGKQKKQIQVHSNDPKMPVFILQIEGTAVADINVSPRLISFGPVGLSESHELNVDIKISSDEPHQVNALRSARGLFDAELITLTEGRHYQAKVTLKPVDKMGNISDTLFIDTTHPGYPSMPVAVRATVQDKLTYAPMTFTAVAAPDRLITRYIMVRSGSVKDFKVTGATWPNPEANVAIQPVTKYGYRIQISNLVATADLNGQHIVITTDVEGKEEIKIPIVIKEAAKN